MMIKGVLGVALRPARAVFFALGLCSLVLVMTACDKKADQIPLASLLAKIALPDFSIAVTLSKQAQAKLQESNGTIHVYARFADSMGPDGLTLGDAEFELREPGTVHFKDIQFPQDKIAALPSPDYEVLVNVSARLRSSAANVLSCDILQGLISVIQHKAFLITCKLIEEGGAEKGNAARREEVK